MKISVVTPIYKDSYLVADFVQSLIALDWNNHQLHEVIFIVDGSGKVDEDSLRGLVQNHFFVKVILLSRNFGQHIAVSAGFNHATGDVVCMINVDQ